MTDQSIPVSFKPVGSSTEGVVAEVSPLADTLGGDVVNKTIIDLTGEDLTSL